MELQDFKGRWRLEREIEDNTGMGCGALRGTAVFAQQGRSLVFQEEGEMVFASAPPMRASRRYLWSPIEDGAAVTFDDGRPFHTVLFRPQWQTHHDCPPDWYEVQYDFSDWPNWHSVWDVRGPRKDYRMVSRYTPQVK